VQWRQTALGEMAIPLSPERLLVTRQVEGVDNGSALPAIVRRRGRAGARIGAVGDVAQPDAGRIECPNVERQGGDS
jgi:hypothetical protein